MGNQHNTSNSHKKISLNHPRFKQTQIVQDNDTMRVCIPIDNQFHFEQWSNKLSKIPNVDDQVILFPKSYRYIRRAICGSSGELHIDFDKYCFILEDQLVNRRQIRKFFDEAQLWYLIYALVSAAHNFKILNTKIGDVRPANIFINEDGQIKIANVYSWPNEPTNYIKTYDENTKTYLAPEELAHMKRGGDSYIDNYKAESFSIGITLLQSALMRDMNRLYNPFTKMFDSARLQEHLKDWWILKYEKQDSKNNKTFHKYSNALKVAVASLCQCDPNKRASSQQIYGWLKTYQKQINELEEFNKQEIPVKNIQKYNAYLQNQSLASPNRNEYQNYAPYQNSATQNFFHKYSRNPANNFQSNNETSYSPYKYNGNPYPQQKFPPYNHDQYIPKQKYQSHPRPYLSNRTPQKINYQNGTSYQTGNQFKQWTNLPQAPYQGVINSKPQIS